MKLLIDAGNTRLKWAFDADMRMQAIAHGGDIAAALAHGFGAENISRKPSGIWVSNVLGASGETALGNFAQQRFGIAPQFIRPQAQAYGITNRYTEPARLGADRWAALVGARHHYAGACCVVNCGTAVTVDALDANGVFLGGAILPGLALARAALLQGTAMLGSTGVSSTDSVFPLNTAEAIASGALYAAVGGIEALFARMSPRLAGARCILAGGDAEAIAAALSIPATVDTALVLKGLRAIAEAHT